MGCSGVDSECRGCSEVHSDHMHCHCLHTAGKRKRDFLFEKFQISECAGSFGAWRHAHRVPPTGDKVLPTAAWGHLQVRLDVPALISCGSWYSRHPSQARQWSRRVAAVGLSKVCSAAGLGELLGSEMIRGATAAGCISGPVQVWSM